MSQHPRVFFEVLRDANLLSVHFPELQACVGVPAGPVCAHGNSDVFEHLMDSLQHVADNGGSLEARLMALVHDLGKALTDPSLLPAHHDHELRTEPVVSFCQRFQFSSGLTARLVTATQQHMRAHNVPAMKNGKRVMLFTAVRRFQDDFVAMVRADALGRGNVSPEHQNALNVLEDVFLTLRTMQMPSSVNSAEKAMQAMVARLRQVENSRK